MWFITKSLLDYIVTSNLSKNKKIDLINENRKKVKKEIKKLNSSQLVHYLFNSKIPNELKQIICEEINELSIKKDEKSKESVKELIKEFKKFNKYKEKYIRLEIFPDIFKSVVIDRVYGGDIFKVISSKSISKDIKKNVIRLRVDNSKDIIKILKSDISIDLVDYVIEVCLIDPMEIRRVLDDDKLSISIKERIIRAKVGMDNLFKVMTYAYDSTIELVFKVKEKEMKDYVDSLTYKNILDVVNDYNVPRKFLDYLVDNKEDVICKAIDKNKLSIIRDTIFKERNEKVVRLIFERRAKVIRRIINDLYDFQLLSWLNLKHLPIEYKQYIITRHKHKLMVGINRLSPYDAKNYLKEDAHIPAEVQDIIFEKCKTKILEDAMKNSPADFVGSIRYSSYIKILKNYLIQEGINENNIFLLLGDRYLDDETLSIVLSSKKDIIKNYLETFDNEELFVLKRKDLNKNAVSRMLESNQDFIRERINTMNKDDLIEYFDNPDVHRVVKKIILEVYFVDEDEVNNLLSLIECYDTKLILDNYDNIKKFIKNTGIDFSSFLQYGSGSRKYPNWLEKILDIINNDEINDFNRCKTYLFDKYYDLKNENSIYVISSFLEYLDNFSKCKDLLIKLAVDNKDLSTADKLNLSFIFNMSSVLDDCPDDLEDLAQYKLKKYENYIKYINHSHVSIEHLKNIFDDVIFCGAKSILEVIGGTGALRTIKKDNIDSSSVVELANELMIYATMIEMVVDTNNLEGLKNVLKHIFGDTEVLLKLQKIYSDFDKKITKLYEMDSNNNLTRIDNARNIEGCLDIEKSIEYGGETFDFSDKNYCLYAHIMSSKEKIDNLIYGVSSGNSNFISVSPVSYRGQKYYWDRENVVFAYDYVPSGNFICSSISNMGTNYKIRNNSSEVGHISRIQRGILETSAVVDNNAEALLYREGLRPCGLILPGNRKPSNKEMEIHNKYGLPFIITQEVKKSIDAPKYVFINDLKVDTKVEDVTEVLELLEMLKPNVSISKEDEFYTGREIAVFTDCHSMYEPTLAVLEEIRRRGISEIYSLGDNVGLGPNPVEVFDLLEEYGVKSIAGNAEYYNTLGTEPFPYLVDSKLDNQLWTERKLGQLRISKLKSFPASIDLLVGNKKIALCHFANDIRWDFKDQNVHTYLQRKSPQQFRYTNSDQAIKKITNCVVSNKDNISIVKGYVAAKGEPLFGGKLVTDYDCILQGHTHFEIDDRLEDTDILTLRALSMGFYGEELENEACYYVLRERKDGDIDIEKCYVSFNRNALLSSIHTCDIPSKERVLKYVKKSR